jgi:Ferric reductase like transmembrane component
LISSCNQYELTINIRDSNFTSAQLAQEHYLTGTLGATAFGALFLFSVRPVRTRAFEFFLILHICLVAIYLACAYLHQPKYVSYFSVLDKLLTAL